MLHRQVDDLQFQLEEQHVISGDQLETVAESSTNQLTTIIRQLEEEKKANTLLQEQLQVCTVLGWGQLLVWAIC